jgi:predicted Holliday junction resolvase-like endonuclease
MIEEVFLFEADPFGVILFALGEFAPEVPQGGRGKRHPSVYHVPFHPREDDIEDQLAEAAHEAMLQQLVEARGVQRATREYDKRIEDARSLSLLSAQRNAAIAHDPLHRPLPTAAASLQKHLKQERERPSILPKNMQDELLRMKRDAALQEANRVREEKKKREEEIRQKRLQNLAKARKARRR